MSNFKDEERISELRKRLYDRGTDTKKRSEYKLADKPTEVSRTWQRPPNAKKQSTPTPPPKKPAAPVSGVEAVSRPDQPRSTVHAERPDTATDDLPVVTTFPMATKKRRSYRVRILLAGLGFFLFALAASSIFFIAGDNGISGENITVTITGPFTVGGGSVIPLQIGVTNDNTVDINSATLIVRYPRGTQSVEEEGKEVFIERLPLDTIRSGETLNIPLRAIVFGEENEEKIIEAEVEYRVEGSNSTFAKIAEPLRFKISSSPVVISVDALHKVSSGQETNIELRIASNAPSPLTNVLVKAEYPTGFDFISSDPRPVSGQNVWLIEKLDPEEQTTINLIGSVVGEETDEYTMHFSTGVSDGNDRYTLESILSTAFTEFELENPFIGVALEINGDRSGTVSANAGETIDIRIEIENTLSDPIYDGRVELSIAGNALSDYTVDAGDGFYDSRANLIYWDASEVRSLNEIQPGQEVRLRVDLVPDPDVKEAPQLSFDVDARARRVTEGRATEELIGTASGAVRVSSVASMITEVGRDTSSFRDTGPLPPVAEEETTYTLTFFVQNGSNDIGDVEVTAPLPGYVTWLDKTAGAGDITYNEVARTITWDAGEINANQSKIAAFQVSLLPSISQIGTTPTLLGDQSMRGTDRFTGAVVRDSYQSLTTRLAEEAGYEAGIGEVQDE